MINFCTKKGANCFRCIKNFPALTLFFHSNLHLIPFFTSVSWNLRYSLLEMSLMKIAEVDKSIRRERQRRSNEDEDDNEIEILSETRRILLFFNFKTLQILAQTASSTNSDEIRRRSDRILDKNLPNAMYIEKSKVDHPPQCRIRLKYLKIFHRIN